MTDKEPYSADDIKRRRRKFDRKIDNSNKEIVLYSEKTHILEDEIIKLRELLPDVHSKKKGKKVKETKLLLEIEAKDQEMRELKTRMSYLRIENINLQKDLKKLKGLDFFSSPVEDLREKAPLNVLVKALQEKINKQEGIEVPTYRKDDERLPYPYIFTSPTTPGDLGLAAESQAKIPLNVLLNLDRPCCKHCGSPLSQGQSVCPSCGNKVI